jgi:bifunctional oligoribonuclease and PAP phosphatase NrnA
MPVSARTLVADALGKASGHAGGVLLYPHVGADGDALGACFGFVAALARIGVDAKVVLEEPVAPPFAFLPGASSALVFDRVISQDLLAFQTIALAVDCEGPPRIGGRSDLFRASPVRLVVDHHPPAPPAPVDEDGTIRFVDPAASCAGELVLRLVDDLSAAAGTDLLDRDSATCLMTALLYDTGGFRFSNTNADSFAAAAALVRHGADPRDLTRRLFDEMSASRFRLLGRAFSSVRYDCGGRVASVSVPQAMLDECGAIESDLDGLAGRLRDVVGVEAAFVLRERADGTVRVNVRSGGGFDASDFSRRFGGGGHARASGFTIESGLDAARERVLEAAARALSCSPEAR